jgi:hypothetical protein
MPRVVRLGVLLVLSVVLGLFASEMFFGLFVKTVPPAVITSFNKGAAHWAFWAYGFVLGLVIFLWSALAALIGGATRGAKPAAPPAKG